MVRLVVIAILTLVVACSDENYNQVAATDFAVLNSSLLISPASGSFGNVAVGSTADLTFTLTNTHNGQNLTGVSQGTPALTGPFSFAGGSYPGNGGTCTSTINKKGGSCTIVLRFAPTSAGNFSTSLAIQSQTGGAGTVYSNTLSLSGTGTQSIVVALAFSETAPYDFQSRAVGSVTTKTLTLRNTTSTASSTLTASFGSSPPFGFAGGAFPGTGGTCSATLPGNSTCTLVLSFSPSAAGSFSSSIQISGANVLTPANFTLQGTGLATQVTGTTDTSFGTAGLSSVDSGSSAELLTSMKIFSNEKVFSGGFGFSNSSNNFIATVQNLSGTLDTSFNTTGTAIVDLGGNDVVQSAMATSDGKIILTGYSDNRFAAVRLNANGSLDTSFNGNGKQVLSLGGDSFSYGGTLDSSDRPILVGTSNANGNYQMAIVRLAANGSLDTSFNGSGQLLLSVGVGASMAFASAIQPDGKILVAGMAMPSSNFDVAIVRLLSDGTLDTSFSGDGIQFVNYGGQEKATALLVQPDGKIMVAGRTQTPSETMAVTLSRLNSDGTLDTTFASTVNGKYRSSFLAADTANAAVVRTSTGEYFIAWTRWKASNPSQNLVQVTKLTSGGVAVGGFGTGGTLILSNILAKQDQTPPIEILGDDRVIVGGTTVNGSNIASTRIW